MQTSGLMPNFSDGTRKTIVGKTPPTPAKRTPPRKSGGKKGR